MGMVLPISQCLPPSSNVHIFPLEEYLLLYNFVDFDYIFILKTALFNIINSEFYIIFCVKVWTSLEFRYIDLLQNSKYPYSEFQNYDKLL